jgi:CBS domain-containing protein
MNHNDILGVTMAGLEAGFKVLHIAAFDVKVCGPDTDVRDVLRDPLLNDFDHIPVREGTRIIGVIERDARSAVGSVKNHMRSLDDSILVSAEEPLPKFLPTLKASSYRLVVNGPEIRGIVTLSDVAKLPVRLLAFTLVTHLEVVLADKIRKAHRSDDGWFSLLHPKQLKTVRGRLKKRKKENLHLFPLEVTDLSHKITIVGKLRGATDFEQQLQPIVKLRNSLDHAADFVEVCGGVTGFLEHLALVEHWIHTLKVDGSGKTMSK